MRGSAFGYEIESELPLARLRAARGTRGVLRLEHAREPPLERFGELTALTEPRDGLAGFALARSGAELVAWCSATGSYLLDPVGGRLCAEPLRGTTPAWEHRLLSLVLPLMLAERGDLLLHAAAVVVRGRALLVCAPTGRGKSTLALTLAALGNSVLAEDGAAVRVEDGSATVWPGPRGIRLKDDAAVALAGALFPPGGDRAQGNLRSERARPARLGRRVALHSLPATAEAEEPVSVGALVVLGERTTALSVEPLTPAEALPALVQNLFHPGRRDGLRPAYGRAARLATLVPAFRASLPDDLAAALPAASGLIERLQPDDERAGRRPLDSEPARR